MEKLGAFVTVKRPSSRLRRIAKRVLESGASDVRALAGFVRNAARPKNRNTTYEIRYEHDNPERLDEVIAIKPKSVHFEVMSDQSIWCGISIDDKTEIRIWISSKNGKSHIQYTAEVEK